MNFGQRVAVLIDGNNMGLEINRIFSKKHMLDYKKFIPNILKERYLVKMTYFREGKSISPKLTNLINDLFFGTTVPCNKSADIYIAIEAVQIVEKVDTIVICSGDCDYVPLIKYIKAKGVRVEIACPEHSLSPLLKEEADNVYLITEKDTFVFS